MTARQPAPEMFAELVRLNDRARALESLIADTRAARDAEILRLMADGVTAYRLSQITGIGQAHLGRLRRAATKETP